MNKEKIKINRKKGVTLFIAVSIMGILLFITYAVTNIALKSTQFATSGRDSQFAFYAADAGMECAIYWDSRFNQSYFDVSTTTNPASIRCGGHTMTTGQSIPAGGASATSSVTHIGGEGTGRTVSTFGFTMNTGANSLPHCTIVTVIKSGATTYIKSRGYNTCDTGNSRRVERGLEVTY